MKLKLREIVWEMTNQCNNNCSYCGSKELRNTDLQVIEHKKLLIDKIAEYPPEILDVSGGDPLLVDYDIHRYLNEKLKGISRHIIINPLSLKGAKDNKLASINLYQYVGVSLNTEEEIKAYEQVKYKIKIPRTFITNFSLLNLYLVDTIASIVGTYPWQVQFTILDELSLTIHDKPQALKMLNSELGKHLQGGKQIIVADNANKGDCMAGINSLGLLWNGLVVPCLSMRSWCKELSAEVQGNLFAEDLEKIWTTRFKDRRFTDCACCKDFCSKAEIAPTIPQDINSGTIITINPSYRQMPLTQQVTMYAVYDPSVTTVVYGVGTHISCDHGVTPVYGVNSTFLSSTKKEK